MHTILESIQAEQKTLRDRLALLDEMERMILAADTPQPPKVPTYTFESDSRLGLFHQTWLVNDEWRCTCEGFTYHGHCKHIRNVESDVRMEKLRRDLRIVAATRN